MDRPWAPGSPRGRRRRGEQSWPSHQRLRSPSARLDGHDARDLEELEDKLAEVQEAADVLLGRRSPRRRRRGLGDSVPQLMAELDDATEELAQLSPRDGGLGQLPSRVEVVGFRGFERETEGIYALAYCADLGSSRASVIYEREAPAAMAVCQFANGRWHLRASATSVREFASAAGDARDGPASADLWEMPCPGRRPPTIPVPRGFGVYELDDSASDLSNEYDEYDSGFLRGLDDSAFEREIGQRQRLRRRGQHRLDQRRISPERRMRRSPERWLRARRASHVQRDLFDRWVSHVPRRDVAAYPRAARHQVHHRPLGDRGWERRHRSRSRSPTVYGRGRSRSPRAHSPASVHWRQRTVDRRSPSPRLSPPATARRRPSPRGRRDRSSSASPRRRERSAAQRTLELEPLRSSDSSEEQHEWEEEREELARQCDKLREMLHVVCYAIEQKDPGYERGAELRLLLNTATASPSLLEKLSEAMAEQTATLEGLVRRQGEVRTARPDRAPAADTPAREAAEPVEKPEPQTQPRPQPQPEPEPELEPKPESDADKSCVIM